jgi:hypothetical protein
MLDGLTSLRWTLRKFIASIHPARTLWYAIMIFVSEEPDLRNCWSCVLMFLLGYDPELLGQSNPVLRLYLSRMSALRRNEVVIALFCLLICKDSLFGSWPFHRVLHHAVAAYSAISMWI